MNQFGARKRHSMFQVLTTLQEKIFDLWRDNKMLCLVSFDVKRPYNESTATLCLGVCDNVKWLDLPQAGLPLTSPLSLILFLFFNADLVQTPINRTRGAITFVGDYNAWIVGLSAQANVQRLYASVIPESRHGRGATASSSYRKDRPDPLLPHTAKDSGCPKDYSSRAGGSVAPG